VLHGRRAAGADVVAEYLAIARRRIVLAARGELRTRPMGRAVPTPRPTSALARRDDPERRTHAPRRRAPTQGLRIAVDADGGARDDRR